MPRKTSKRPRKTSRAKRKTSRATRKTSQKLDQKSLTKGQLRKLNALRKSVGDTIGTRAFAAWYTKQNAEKKKPVDKNAELITGALETLIKTRKLTIPRGGYLLKRGKKRVIVTRAAR